MFAWLLVCIWLMASAALGRRGRRIAVKAASSSLLLPEYICAARLDRESLFSLFSLDVVQHLCLFLPHRRGLVRDPSKLRYNSTILHKVQTAGDISFDMHGNLIANLFERGEINVYDIKEGRLLWKIAEQLHDCPFASVEDSSGLLYASESRDVIRSGRMDHVKVFCRTGGDGGVYTMKKKIGVEHSKGLALSNNEELLYVCSDHPYNTVNVLCTSDLRKVERLGFAIVERPFGVAVLSTDEVVVSSGVDNGSLHVFKCDGQLVRSIGKDILQCPHQVAVDAHDNIYVANTGKNEVVVFSAAGDLVCRLAGQFKNPYGIAISPRGWVAVSEMGRVQLFRCE